MLSTKPDYFAKQISQIRRDGLPFSSSDVESASPGRSLCCTSGSYTSIPQTSSPAGRQQSRSEARIDYSDAKGGGRKREGELGGISLTRCLATGPARNQERKQPTRTASRKVTTALAIAAAHPHIGGSARGTPPLGARVSRLGSRGIGRGGEARSGRLFEMERKRDVAVANEGAQIQRREVSG